MADNAPNLTELTVDLLSAYLGASHHVRPDDLPALIASTHTALAALGQPSSSEGGEQATLKPGFEPAVTARKSLASREHILSMIDGKPYKTLKRHLATNGLTPDQYRERYKLPASYPMTAPAYSEARRSVAQALGLGRRRQGGKQPAGDQGSVGAEASAGAGSAASAAPKRRGRKPASQA